MTMSIVTKRGDRGRTSLLFGGVVDKDDPRVELEGVLDELSSFLGLAKSLLKDKASVGSLESLQKDLIAIGAEVATRVSSLSNLKKRIGHKDVRRLESLIKGLEKKRKIKKFCFYLPGSNFASGLLDVSRTIARRAERRAVTLSKKKILRNPSLLVYLNRLSDLLYLLARENR